MSFLATPVAAHLAIPAPSAGTGGAKTATCVSQDAQSGNFYIAYLLPGIESPARDARPARVTFDARRGAPRLDFVAKSAEGSPCQRPCHGSGQGRRGNTN